MDSFQLHLHYETKNVGASTTHHRTTNTAPFTSQLAVSASYSKHGKLGAQRGRVLNRRIGYVTAKRFSESLTGSYHKVTVIHVSV